MAQRRRRKAALKRKPEPLKLPTLCPIWLNELWLQQRQFHQGIVR